MKKLFYYLLMLPLLCALAACGEDEPNPDNPEETVPDPAGTITIKMRYDDATSIDGVIKIDESYNFHGGQFVSVGQCKGLGNVTRIPKTGWASSVAVTPGCGYVANVPSSNLFYRLYVTGTMTDTSGGIIGYTVKYQSPFYGPDEELKLEKTSLSFGKDGGSESVKVLNENVIPFSVESTASWIYARPASTGVSYLNDAIFIQVKPAERESSEGIVRVTYGKNKSVDIKVTRTGRPFIDLGLDNYSFSPEGGEESFPVQSNLELAKLKIEFDQDDVEWLVAGLETAPKASLSRLKYIGGQPAAEVLKTAVESKVNNYSLRLKASPNIGGGYRSVSFLVRGEDVLSQKITVSQSHGYVRFSSPEISLGQGAANQEVGIIATRVDLSKLTVSVKDKWCRAILDAKASVLKIVVDANDSESDRQTLVSLLNSAGESVAELKVGQRWIDFALEKNELSFGFKEGEKKVGIVTKNDVSGFIVSSTEKWCKPQLDKSSKSIIVKVEQNVGEERRSAEVSVLSPNKEELGKISVSQAFPQISVEKSVVHSDRQGGIYSLDVSLPAEITQEDISCSADWMTVTLTPDRSRLNLRITESTVDRIAVISIAGRNCIEVHQSKYAVGDTYSENGIEGQVFYLSGGVGKIYRKVADALEWSLENVGIGAVSYSDGRENMEVVKAQPNWQAQYPAFVAVEALNVGGVSGWNIPARDEVRELRFDYVFWTSTERYNSHVWLSNGVSANKDSKNAVVAIRRFEY